MAKANYKPLLYTTTVRNPERYKAMMNILKRFDGWVLNDETIESVEREMFRLGIYQPAKVSASVKTKWRDSIVLSADESKSVYDRNDPNKHDDIKGHKEKGFPKGWPSRFDTQFKFMKTLGFVWYEYEARIIFSKTGDYLAQSVEIDSEDDIVTVETVKPEYERMAFLQALSKQQRGNPFIKELNDNIPLILLLQVVKKLNADPDYNNCGISYKELPLLIFWKDNDAEALYQRIKRLRKDYDYTPSGEIIEEICIQEILGGSFKEFKLKSIVSEYPDEFVRKMRITGLVSLRGGGRFIDINHSEDERVEYILSKYSKYKKYSDEKEYLV